MLVFVTKGRVATGPLALYCDTFRYDTLNRLITRFLIVKWVEVF